MDIKERFMSHVEAVPEAGCWIWTGALLKGGYGIFGGSANTRTAHRVSYELFNGPIPDDKMVLHTCDVRCCVNPYHLYLGTHARNMADRHERGRDAKGERHGSVTKPGRLPRGAAHHKTKFTEDDVHFIRGSNWTLKAMAEKFDVSINAVWLVKTGKNWAHLKEI